MRTTRTNRRPANLVRALFGTILALTAVCASIPARAGEIIPSVGITKPVHAGDADASIYGGLAFRGDLAPILKSEVGVAYRTEDRMGGDLKVRQWPITGSLWLAPVRNIYAGGGVGWYQTTYDYSSSVAARDFTKQKFGVHLGGGFNVPLSPALAIDMNGRYVYLQKEKGISPPQDFDPDFWSTTAGLAFRF
jgi:outer membrane protein with beta-barrel domain